MKYLITLLMLLISTPAFAAWEDVKNTIAEVAIETNYPVENLAAVSYLESSFRASVTAEVGTATGLMQITRPTWNHLVKTYGKIRGVTTKDLRTDPRANSLMGVEYIKENDAIMTNALGRKLSLFETYMGYKFGPHRAVRFLRASNSTPLIEFYPTAAKYNPAVYFHEDGTMRTVGEVKSMFRNRVSKALSLYARKANMALEQYTALMDGLKSGICRQLKLTKDDVIYMAHEQMKKPLHTFLSTASAFISPKEHYTSDYFANEYEYASGRRYNSFMI